MNTTEEPVKEEFVQEIKQFTKKFSSKINQIKEIANSFFFERELTIDAILLSILSKDNTFIYGDTGTGKTELIRCLMSHFPSLKLFCQQGGHDTTKDDIFGPINIKKLTHDSTVERIRKGFALEADVIFIDEFGDVPPKVQRALLGIASKNRFFKNGSEEEYWKGRTCIFASNFFQKNELTKAVNDRMLLKTSVNYLNNSLKEYLMTPNLKYSNNGVFIESDDLKNFDNYLDNINLTKIGIMLIICIFNKYNEEIAKDTSKTKETTIFSNMPRLSDRALKEFINIIKVYALMHNHIYTKKDLITNEEKVFVKNSSIFNSIKFLSPIDNGIVNKNLQSVLKEVEKTIFSKHCYVPIHTVDPKTKQIVVEEQDIDIALSHAVEAFNKMHDIIITSKKDSLKDPLKDGWNVDDPSSMICFMNNTFSTISNCVSNPDIFKQFPIISMEEITRFSNIADCLNIIIQKIKASGGYKFVTYEEIINIINNSNIIKTKKTSNKSNPI